MQGSSILSSLTNSVYGGSSLIVERPAVNRKARGQNPAPPQTMPVWWNLAVTLRLERSAVRRPGSSPGMGTNKPPPLDTVVGLRNQPVYVRFIPGAPLQRDSEVESREAHNLECSVRIRVALPTNAESPAMWGFVPLPF